MKLFYYSALASLILSIAITPAYSANDTDTTPPTGEQLADKAHSSVPSGDDTDITIIQKKDAVIKEVRVNGKLRYAKITPKNGKPYYMYDSDGDGVLDATETDTRKANVNQWILLEW